MLILELNHHCLQNSYESLLCLIYSLSEISFDCLKKHQLNNFPYGIMKLMIHVEV